MNNDKQIRPARGESLMRATLALALAAAVVWALTADTGAFHGLGFAG